MQEYWCSHLTQWAARADDARIMAFSLQSILPEQTMRKHWSLRAGLATRSSQQIQSFEMRAREKTHSLLREAHELTTLYQMASGPLIPDLAADSSICG